MGGEKVSEKPKTFRRSSLCPLVAAITGLVVGLPFLTLSFLTVLCLVPGTMQGVVEEINNLKVGKRWRLMEERRHPYVILRFHDAVMPSMFRIYELPEPIDEDEFKIYAYQDGWEVDGYECETNEEDSLINQCSFSGSKGMFQLSVNLFNHIPGRGIGDNTKPEVHYYVRK
ncbi:MAG: hypothetical protein LBH36_01030 [Candidatus Nomurabacteria bacterium]|jgi:hypothetical protein|nr:hypothetical protein [Candidatus Nomurabacteria bacterium]